MSIDFSKMSKKQLINILRNVENACLTFEFASKEEVHMINPEWHEGRKSAFEQSGFVKLYILKCK